MEAGLGYTTSTRLTQLAHRQLSDAATKIVKNHISDFFKSSTPIIFMSVCTSLGNFTKRFSVFTN